MNNIEFEQELNNLISKSIYKKLKIYNCKCTRCSSLFIANLDDIQCNICKNKNLNKIFYKNGGKADKTINQTEDYHEQLER